ncbi:hypothetical protein ABLE91_23735 [Aquabacter sp. CN5-332]|uniref:hypothetical protein n=1 Tax=Aquabacter sp. CN5-332 TaxID=3156608 RepID=UPI0032B395CB
MTRLGLGIPSAAVYRGRRAHPVEPLPSEVAGLLARMSPAAPAPRAAEISTLVSALLAAGLWQKLDAFYMLAAHDAQAARLNWIADHYNLTAVNTPAFLADRGYAGNGTNSYLDTSFNPATAAAPHFTQNAASIGAWSLTNQQGSSALMGGVSTGGQSYLLPWAGDGNMYVTLNRAGDNARPSAGHSLGLFSASRLAFGSFTSHVNGANAVVSPVGAVAPGSGNFYIGARNTQQFTTRRIAFAFMGDGLTDGEVAGLYAAVRTYLLAVGAVAP